MLESWFELSSVGIYNICREEDKEKEKIHCTGARDLGTVKLKMVVKVGGVVLAVLVVINLTLPFFLQLMATSHLLLLMSPGTAAIPVQWSHGNLRRKKASTECLCSTMLSSAS